MEARVLVEIKHVLYSHLKCLEHALSTQSHASMVEANLALIDQVRKLIEVIEKDENYDASLYYEVG